MPTHGSSGPSLLQPVKSLEKALRPYYQTSSGRAFLGDAGQILPRLRSKSTNLVITSPPFGLNRKKEYGNVEANEYVKWFSPFAQQVHRLLVDDGSFVLHLGSSWKRGEPVKNLYIYRLLLFLCDNLGFKLAQDIYAYNPARLPGPAQWVTIRRVRLKDSVDLIWWLSKSAHPKSDNRRILKSYSESMKKLLNDRNYYRPDVRRPSGHTISSNFWKNNGGAIPPNAFSIPNTAWIGENVVSVANTSSRDAYRDRCLQEGIKSNPARFHWFIPHFFIRFLTEPGDVVLDPFSGSNVTGREAENLGRRWIAIEKDHTYVKGSVFRFSEVKSLLVNGKTNGRN